MVKHLLFVLIIALVLGACSSSARKNRGLAQKQDSLQIQDARDRQYLVKVGDPAPDFEMTFPNGEKIKLSDLRGKVVMLQFTASWCGVCRKEMPASRATSLLTGRVRS